MLKRWIAFSLLLLLLVCFLQAADVAPTPPTSAQDLESLKPEEPDHFVNQLTNMLTTLGVILGLILLVTWFLRKMLHTRIQQMNTSSNIKVLESRNISTKSSIHVLDVYGKGIVVAESLNGITPISQFVIDTESPSDFAKLMQDKK